MTRKFFKKIAVLLAGFLLFASVGMAFGQGGGQTTNPVSNPALGYLINVPTFGQLFTGVIDWLLFFAGSIAVLFLLVGGYQYITAAGNEERMEKGKKILWGSVIGLVIIIMAYAVVVLVTDVVIRDPGAGVPITDDTPECSDQVDNDSDFLIDLSDPGCENLIDEDEGNITPPPPLPIPPSLTFNAIPGTVNFGDFSTLGWTSFGATSCVASGDWGGTKPPNDSVRTGSLTASVTYTLTCTGPGGEVTESTSVTVAVPPPEAPTLSFNADDTTINSGGAATLTWTSSNATSCTASGDWSGNKSLSGTELTDILTAPATYTLACAGVGESVSKSVIITINIPPPPNAPTMSFSANPTTIDPNQSSLLKWSTSGADSCTASGDWSGDKPLNNTAGETTGSLSASATYTLACTGAGGTTTRTATVTVNIPPPPPASLLFEANPKSLSSGQTTYLAWDAQNTTSCVASGDWSGSQPANGTFISPPLTSGKIYTLTCTGPGGSITDTEIISVGGGLPDFYFTMLPKTFSCKSGVNSDVEIGSIWGGKAPYNTYAESTGLTDVGIPGGSSRIWINGFNKLWLDCRVPTGTPAGNYLNKVGIHDASSPVKSMSVYVPVSWGP